MDNENEEDDWKRKHGDLVTNCDHWYQEHYIVDIDQLDDTIYMLNKLAARHEWNEIRRWTLGLGIALLFLDEERSEDACMMLIRAKVEGFREVAFRRLGVPLETDPENLEDFAQLSCDLMADGIDRAISKMRGQDATIRYYLKSMRIMEDKIRDLSCKLDEVEHPVEHLEEVKQDRDDVGESLAEANRTIEEQGVTILHLELDIISEQAEQKAVVKDYEHRIEGLEKRIADLEAENSVLEVNQENGAGQ